MENVNIQLLIWFENKCTFSLRWNENTISEKEKHSEIDWKSCFQIMFMFVLQKTFKFNVKIKCIFPPWIFDISWVGGFHPLVVKRHITVWYLSFHCTCFYHTRPIEYTDSETVCYLLHSDDCIIVCCQPLFKVLFVNRAFHPFM